MSATTPISDMLDDPAFREADPSRILEWDKIEDYGEVVAYYQQRFGPTFRPPAFLVDAEVFESLLVGETPLLAQMSYFAPEAFDSFKSAFAKNDEAVYLLFSVDSADPAKGVIDFIRQQMDEKNPVHVELLSGLDEMSRKCGEFYLEWVRRGRPIYRINIPRRQGPAERLYVA